MALQIIPNRQSLEQLALLQLLGNAGQTGVENFRGFQAQERQQAEQLALAELMGGKAGTMTPGQADPRKMTVGSGAGTLGTPPTRGMIPGLTPDQARQFVDAGLGAPLAQVGVAHRFPQPVDPVSVRAGGSLVDPRTGQAIYTAPAAPDEPNSVREARALGFDLGTPEGAQGYAQWRQSLTREPAGTTIKLPPNRPPLKPGEQYVLDDAGEVVGIQALPGGEVEREQQALAAKEQGRQAAAERQMRVVSRETGRVLDIIDDPDWSGGLIARGAAVIPGTDAFQAAQSLTALGAIVSFDTLNQMRANSPTGGALGSVTERELELLRAVPGSLDISQDPAVLAENLTEFERTLSEIVNGPGGAPRESVNLGTGERVAINPQTGERLVLRNGQWVAQ